MQYDHQKPHCWLCKIDTCLYSVQKDSGYPISIHVAMLKWDNWIDIILYMFVDGLDGQVLGFLLQNDDQHDSGGGHEGGGAMDPLYPGLNPPIPVQFFPPYHCPLFFLIFFFGYPRPKLRFFATAPTHLTPARFSSKDPNPRPHLTPGPPSPPLSSQTRQGM